MGGLSKRILALAPVVLSAVVVALTIVMMVAGPISNSGDTGYWMSLNASKMGTNVIVLSTATPGQPNPTDPMGIIKGLDNLFGGFIDNITNTINQGVNDLTGNLMTSLTKSLGVRDVYNFYLTGVCQGYYVNPNDPNSPVNINKCSSYTDELSGMRNISRSIPSSFVIGNTNISVPMIAAMGHTVSTMSTLSTLSTGVILALLAISCAAAGATMLGSVAAALLGYRRRLLVFNAAASAVAAAILFLFATAGTTVSLAMAEAISGFGAAFTLQTRTGNAFLAEAWFAAMLGSAVASFWGFVWFIEGRRHALKRRVRTPDQIGNYRGIMKELKWDWKVERYQQSHVEQEKMSVEHEKIWMPMDPRAPEEGSQV